MTFSRFITSLVIVFAVFGQNPVSAQPQPSDLFREYSWANSNGDAGGSLRVGGKLDYGGGPINLPHTVDLEHAIRAEVVIEKLLCHDGTHGLAISWNGHEPFKFPEATGIPAPQWDYQHFKFPVVDVPLDQLKPAEGNSFKLHVDAEHSWNWPQNLIYGLQLRIYYDSRQKLHPTGRVTLPASNGTIGLEAELLAEVKPGSAPIKNVDFLGLYDGINWEGDGQYQQWHVTWFQGNLRNHLGTATAAPWQVFWDTSWIPDQDEEMQLAARITDGDGLTYFTPAIPGLTLDRPGLSVELCRPYDMPTKWVTRVGEKSEKFRIAGNLQHAAAARFVWSSWSPGYMDGLFLNGTKVFDREGPRYACFQHTVPLDDLSQLQTGENILTTGLTPKYNGKTVHGMEVNWPGIMVLIQYRTETDRSQQ